jgi:hypothetical protein
MTSQSLQSIKEAKKTMKVVVITSVKWERAFSLN